MEATFEMGKSFKFLVIGTIILCYICTLKLPTLPTLWMLDTSRVPHMDNMAVNPAEGVEEYTQTPSLENKDGIEIETAEETPTEKLPEMERLPRTCESSVRTDHIREYCRDQNLGRDPIQWEAMIGNIFIVDDERKIMYCMIPKTATHSFRTVLGELAIGKIERHMWYPLDTFLNFTGFRLLQRIDDTEREVILETYYKFMVVRHPFSRLHSSYMNKMAKPGGLNEQVLAGEKLQIVNTYLRARDRLGQDQTFDPLNDTITMEDFLHLVGYRYGTGFRDEHWRPQYSMCLPCHIRYDHVFRVETLEQDTNLFFQYLESVGERPPTSLEQGNVDTFVYDPNEKLKTASEEMVDIKVPIVNRLLALYEKDFKLLGYHWNPRKGAQCRIMTNDTRCC